MDNAEKQKDNTQAVAGTASKDALQAKTDGISDAKAQETSQKPPETYTKDQMLNFRSDALAEQGKKHKAEVDAVRQERDGAVDKLGDYDDLRKRYDELTSKDEGVFTLSKEADRLRGISKAETARERLNSERIKKADNYERDISITKTVEDYEGGDFDKLKGLCETFNTSSEEQIRKAADTLWDKKFVPPTTPESPTLPVKPYSGMTSGGTKDLSKLTPDEKIMEGLAGKF